jgi:hypothetical protein
MLNSEPEAPGSQNIMKFVAAAAAVAALAGCAIAVPLPPLATSFQESRDGHFACNAGSKCPNETTNHRVAYHRSQPVGHGKIADDPPDFILSGGDLDGMPPTTTRRD